MQPGPLCSLKRFPEWEDWQTYRALETLHWCPEGTVADQFGLVQYLAWFGPFHNNPLYENYVVSSYPHQGHMENLKNTEIFENT